MSEASAGITDTVGASPELTSASTWIFMPKYHWLLFFVWPYQRRRRLAARPDQVMRGIQPLGALIGFHHLMQDGVG